MEICYLFKSNKKYKSLIFLIYILLNIYLTNTYAYINSYIQNNTNNNFTSDDLIELVIKTNDDINNLDLAPLNKNFEIMGQSKQVSHSIINNQASTEMQLIISLKPKTYGKLTIPSLILNNTNTNAINIYIKDISTDPEYQNKIFITAEANNNQVYVKSGLKINLTINYADDIIIRNLELSSPENPDMLLYKLNESDSQAFHNNQKYMQHKIQYLVFYNKSGNNLLPKFNLSGMKLKDNQNNNDFFARYQQQWKHFSRGTPDVPIKVLPPNKTFKNKPWLVADDIELKEEWSNNNNELPLGDAIQRTITIKAKNIPAEYLPILFDPDNPNNKNSSYKKYIDKPELENKIENNNLISILTQKITYITTKPGELKIKPINISFWDNINNKTKVISLKEKSFTINNNNLNNNYKNKIESNFNSNNEQNSIQSKSPVQEQNQNTDQNLTQNQKIDQKQSINLNSNNIDIHSDKNIHYQNYNSYYNKIFYVLITIIVILSIIVISLVIILLSPSSNNKSITKNNLFDNKQENNHIKINKSIIDNNLNKLKLAAKDNNSTLTYQILTKITDHIFKSNNQYFSNTTSNNTNINTVSELKKSLSTEQQDNINNLLASLYGINKSNWDNDFFTQEIIPAIKQIFYKITAEQNIKDKSTSKLDPLYPE